jgi:hypothetical protein
MIAARSVDVGRAVRARVTAMLIQDANHRSAAGPELCDGSGWKMRRSCAGHDGRISCPLCVEPVTATPASGGVVAIDPHYPRRGGEAS